MLRLAEYITVAIAATLKFVGGPIAGAALQLKWWETTLSSAIGLMITVFTVIYGGEIIKKIVKSFRKDKPRRIFTKPNRLTIRWIPDFISNLNSTPLTLPKTASIPFKSVTAW